MLAEAILVHGDIGYKFCLLLLSEDRNQGTPTGHKSNGIVVEEGANFTVILSFQCTCDDDHKFDDFSFILLTFLIISSICSYFNISFNLVLVNLSLCVVLFSFVSLFLLQLILVVYAKLDTRQWRKACET